MTAKEYLRQLRVIERQLKELLKERDELERAQTYLRSPRMDGDWVQTSPTGDPPWMEYIIRMDELTLKIAAKFVELMEKKDVINDHINSLDPRYAELLYKRYVEGKRFDKIAREMGYSIDHVLHLHGEALREIQHKITSRGVV